MSLYFVLNSATFVDLVTVAGNSIVRIDYEATDEDPLPGTSYNRLMQKDFDGQTSFSDW